MVTAASAPNCLPKPPQAAVPVRSPRTSIILAELTRQRRLERCRRRLKRQQRRRAWARWAGWLPALGHRPFESIRMPAVAGLIFSGTVPLVYALNA
jgi:hypothetical protein